MSDQLDRISTILSALSLNAPWQRFLGIGAAVAVALYLVQPSPFFANGRAKPWSVLSLGASDEEGDDGTPSTAVPFWMVALVAGFLGATFL